MKKLALFLALLMGLSPARLSANDRVLLVARSYVGRKPISGLQFGCQGVISKPTNRGGATEVDLPTGYSTGRQVKIDLIATRKAKGESWRAARQERKDGEKEIEQQGAEQQKPSGNDSDPDARPADPASSEPNDRRVRAWNTGAPRTGFRVS